MGAKDTTGRVCFSIPSALRGAGERGDAPIHARRGNQRQLISRAQGRSLRRRQNKARFGLPAGRFAGGHQGKGLAVFLHRGTVSAANQRVAPGAVVRGQGQRQQLRARIHADAAPVAGLNAGRYVQLQGNGIAADTDIMSGKLNKEGYVSVAKQLTDRFGCKAVAITLRGSISASENNWAGMLYMDGKSYLSKNYLIKLVDRVGGGDSFGGGLIHAMRKGMAPQDIIEFAVAASCLKQTIEHDFNLCSEKEVLALMGGNASGRVQR